MKAALRARRIRFLSRFSGSLFSGPSPSGCVCCCRGSDPKFWVASCQPNPAKYDDGSGVHSNIFNPPTGRTPAPFKGWWRFVLVGHVLLTFRAGVSSWPLRQVGWCWPAIKASSGECGRVRPKSRPSYDGSTFFVSPGSELSALGREFMVVFDCMQKTILGSHANV
jgi:hypothetical protein